VAAMSIGLWGRGKFCSNWAQFICEPADPPVVFPPMLQGAVAFSCLGKNIKNIIYGFHFVNIYSKHKFLYFY
jgi:hypothetical protein